MVLWKLIDFKHARVRNVLLALKQKVHYFMSARSISRIIFLLLTWPVGIVMVPKITMVGFELEPYAPAVHEMVIILILCMLMIASARHFFSTASSAPVFRTVWYGLRVSFAAFVLLSLSPAPLYLNGSGSERLAVYCGMTFLIVIVVLGIASTYKYMVSSNTCQTTTTSD